ncbi:phosphonate ABC transporter, permease protein PhnE [soil metagenome]
MPAAVATAPADDRGAATGPDPSLRPPWDRRRLLLVAVAVGLVLATAWSWVALGMSVTVVFDGAGDVVNLLGRMLPPRFVDVGRIVDLALETVFMALLGTALAVVLSVPLALFAARNTTPNRFAYGAARGVIVLARAVPDLVFALIFVRALGIGPLPGILALGLHSIGMIGKLFADAVEQIDEGPRDAVISTGASKNQSLLTAVLPQVLPSFIATALYRLDINLRISVVLGVVGAGGIGFELQNTLRQLVYDRGLGVVLVIVVLVIGVEVASAALRATLLRDEPMALRGAPKPTIGDRLLRLLGRARSELTTGAPSFDRQRLSPPWTRERKVKTAYAVGTALALVVAFVQVDVAPFELFGALPDIADTAASLFPPDFTTVRGDMIDAMVETVQIGLVATFLGTLLAVPAGLLAARNVAPARWVYSASRLFLVLERSIPELILAIIFVAAIGLGPVPGVFALALGTLGFMAKLVADSVEEIAPGPREAVFATGATRLQETATSVVPQAFPAFVSSFLYVLDVNIRTATILGIVGGGGIGFLLFNSLRTLNFEVTGAILVMIFVVVYGIERLSGWVRKHLI